MPHVRRARFPGRHPVHATVRLGKAVRQLRNGKCFRVVWKSIAAANNKGKVRLVEFGVLSNHIHFVVEAAGAEALARGMQGLCIRIARGLNRELGRKGRVFADRYHARALATPTEVRNAVRYVMLNQRKHAAERGARFDREWVDPYSSGPYFDGWKGVNRPAHWFAVGPKVTVPPETWLLDKGWRLRGLIPVADIP